MLLAKPQKQRPAKETRPVVPARPRAVLKATSHGSAPSAHWLSSHGLLGVWREKPDGSRGRASALSGRLAAEVCPEGEGLGSRNSPCLNVLTARSACSNARLEGTGRKGLTAQGRQGQAPSGWGRWACRVPPPGGEKARCADVPARPSPQGLGRGRPIFSVKRGDDPRE